MIKEQLLEPYVELNTEYYESLEALLERYCKMLEQEGAIIPVPQSGLFVSESFLEKPARQMRIVFVFPEVEISPQVLDLEGWGLISELNRGFHAGKRGAAGFSVH